MSEEISTIMTRLGYGEEIRHWRVEKYRECDRLDNKIRSDLAVITSGSKAEGLTCCFESDLDSLFLLNNVLCVEAGIILHTIPNDIEVYSMDTHVYPGHCRLFLERQAPRGNYTDVKTVLLDALCDNGYGDVLLSSSLLMDKFSAQLRIRIPTDSHVVFSSKRAGPSIPGLLNGVFHLDSVLALRCNCPSILHRWAARPRHWPPPFIVQKVVSLGAYVTPVGFKGSESNHMEWRICFNTGESELVNNLNDTQAKVYVMLKMILKDIMKPKNKEITSYVLKNIILWQAENTPQTEFHPSSLLHWLHDGLRELRTAIEKKQLRYYMIPDRNLMAACGLEDALQRKWVADITDMMDEGPRVILRLKKIRKAIVGSPEPLLWFSRRRMEMEMLQLEKWRIRRMQCGVENGKEDRIEQICKEVGLRMLLEGGVVNDLTDIFIRMLQA